MGEAAEPRAPDGAVELASCRSADPVRAERAERVEAPLARGQDRSRGAAWLRLEPRLFQGALLGPTLLYLGTLWRYRGSQSPDGYDAVGFALALERFDLARLQPHPPGYPVLIAAGRALVALGLSPLQALAVANALGLGAGLAALAWLLRRSAGATAGWLGLALLTLSPLCWALGTGTLSDGLGLGLLLLACAAAQRGATPVPTTAGDEPASAGWLLLAGLLGGLALGARPSYAPVLALLLAAGLGQRSIPLGRPLLHLLAGALAGTLAWLVPLLSAVGPRRYLTLCLAHLRGHVQDFGGSVVTDSAPWARAQALLEGALAGALGPSGLGALLLVAVLLLRARVQRSTLTTTSPGQRSFARGLLLLCAGYAVYVLLLQPVRGHGRHLLPLSVALLAWTALLLGGISQRSTSTAGPLSLRGGQGLALLALVALQGSGAATWIAALRGQEAPAARLARRVVKLTDPGTPLYGARAARQLDWLRGAGAARPARYLGEVIVDRQRTAHSQDDALLTSEVQAAPTSQARLRTLGRFCPHADLPALLQFDREARSAAVNDREARSAADPCLSLLAYRDVP